MDRERVILDAAAAVFYEKGFHGAGMDELGTRAGLSGPALYRHFSGKNEILAALFNEAMDELMPASTVQLDDVHADLVRLVRHHIAFTIANRHLVNVYQREDRSLVDPWLRHFNRRRRQYVDNWGLLIARRHPQAAPRHVATATQATLGLIFSIAYWPTKVAAAPDTAAVVEGMVFEGFSTWS